MKSIIFILLISGCVAHNDVIVTTQVVPDTNYCYSAEANLRNLQCRDSTGDLMWQNKSGEHFATTCKRIQEEGGVYINPKCISNAKTCEELNVCPQE